MADPPRSMTVAAIASPIPPAPPVTTATHPSHEPMDAAYGPSYDRHVVDDAGQDPDLDALELDAFDRVTFTDDELTELALEAEPFDPFDPSIEPFNGLDSARFAVIPEWYMPAPGIPRTKGRAAVLVGLALSLIVITVGGFCVTYGVPEFIWKW
jgi:hypothetical protein